MCGSPWRALQNRPGLGEASGSFWEHSGLGPLFCSLGVWHLNDGSPCMSTFCDTPQPPPRPQTPAPPVPCPPSKALVWCGWPGLDGPAHGWSPPAPVLRRVRAECSVRWTAAEDSLQSHEWVLLFSFFL